MGWSERRCLKLLGQDLEKHGEGIVLEEKGGDGKCLS